MKILEICPFSKGVCGVWTRVSQEAKELKKLGHEVTVFSSYEEKGTGNICSLEDELDGIKIFRFKSNANKLDKLISKNVTYFNFDEELIQLIKAKKVDLVITHLLHPHSFKAVKICKKYDLPCYLVTHAPFNVKRKFPLNLATSIFNQINVKNKINNFTKILAITEWEMPYLLKLNVNKSKIVYIPNGIPKEFFKEKVKPFQGKSILFLGRISPVKNLEVLIDAISLLENKNIHLKIVGPIEEPYGAKLVNQIKSLNIEAKIEFLPPIYNLSKKITYLQEADIFVLPSIREAMPQSLIEAMSLGKIVIASKTEGGKEIITNNKNGFLFEINNSNELKNKISFCLDKKNLVRINKIKNQAREDSYKYSWEKLISKLNNLIIK